MTISGCSGAKYLERTGTGEASYLENDYQTALLTAEEIIRELPQKQTMIHGQVYALAGNSAFALEQYEKSREYLEKARQLEYASELMYMNLAYNYRKIDNLSREISILEDYLRLFPDGNEIDLMQERLFQTCRESMNYDQAMNLWPRLNENAWSDIDNMVIFLEINIALENDSVCNATAKNLLGNDANNEPALKWFGEKYFWKAENRYQAEMNAYAKNRTHKQYSILLKAFKTVTSDFKTSLSYFTKLYRLNPSPDYAKYLGNIYTRLDDDQKARYYLGKAKQD